MRLCEWCNKEIENIPSKRVNIFCDKKCYQEWNTSFKNKLTCSICSREYFQSSERAKISNCCSKACRAVKAGEAAKISHMIRGNITIKCDNCSCAFTTNKSRRIGHKVFCKKACQNEFHKHNKSFINCIQCGTKSYKKKYQLKTAKYCSQACKNEYQKTIKGKDHPCYKHGFKTYRRDALEHFKYTCQSCGKVERRLQVHHIDGNNKHNDPSNWMILCCLCHRRVHLGKIPLPPSP